MSIREMLLGPEKIATARQGQQVVGASDGVLGSAVNVQSGSTLRGAPTGTPAARTPVRQMLAAPQMSQQPPVARQGTQVVGVSDGVLGSAVNVRSGAGLRGMPTGTPVAPADRVPVRPAPTPSPAVAGGTGVMRQQMPGGPPQAPVPGAAVQLPAFNGASARAELGKLRAGGDARMSALQSGGAQTAPTNLAPLTGSAASGSLRGLTGTPPAPPAAPPGGAVNGARGVFAGAGMAPRAAPVVGANTEQGRFATAAQAVRSVPGIAGPAAASAVSATQRQYDNKMGVGTAPSADLKARPSLPPGMQRSLPTAPVASAYNGVRPDSASSGYPGAASAASRIPAQPVVPAPPPAAPKLPVMGGGSGGVASAPKAPAAPKPAVNSAATQAPKLAQPVAPKAT